VIGRLAVAWLDLTDAARAWWRRNVIGDCPPRLDACESCGTMALHCDERQAATCKLRPHTRDEDCTLDAHGSCIACGVYHGDRCDCCGGRGFHRDNCPSMET
jgi:hypothetical protein